ncbi:MAG: flagellar protein [Candidatus Eisenbacteria sp.]|nr:flagellar protein [Candidatus Eisenbacteria bacterium]
MNGIGRVGPAGTGPGAGVRSERKGAEEFKTAWRDACEKQRLKFSRHAMERLETRNVSLQQIDLERLGSAVARAGEKGARESLVLLDEMAFVVSVRNRTVITAMQTGKDGVFTSIDSAVIA